MGDSHRRPPFGRRAGAHGDTAAARRQQAPREWASTEEAAPPAVRQSRPDDVAKSVATGRVAARGRDLPNAESPALQGLPDAPKRTRTSTRLSRTRPQPGNSTVISVRCVPDRPYRPAARTIRTHRTIWMLPRCCHARGAAHGTATPQRSVDAGPRMRSRARPIRVSRSGRKARICSRVPCRRRNANLDARIMIPQRFGSAAWFAGVGEQERDRTAPGTSWLCRR